MDHQEKFRKLEEMNLLAEQGGGEERKARQHAAGKKTARERIEMMADPGTFR